VTVLRRVLVAGAASAAVGGLYVGLVTGAAPLDLGVGRRHRELGPLTLRIAAPRTVVFDVIAAPYSERPTRAMQEKVTVLERGADMVLAAHHTPVGERLRARTVETVHFTPPERVAFRLVRGPVPHVVETFDLDEDADGTVLRYHGALGTDLWWLGRWWGDLVAERWERVVAASLDSVREEAERRARRT
jgi:hypothetical protein